MFVGFLDVKRLQLQDHLVIVYGIKSHLLLF